jgi:hypothetical protein
MEPKPAEPPRTLAEHSHADGAASDGDEAGAEAEEHDQHGHSDEEDDGSHSLDAG